MARKVYYRGKEAEELTAMPLDQFMSLVDSRARRYLKRLPYDYRQLLAKVKKIGTSKPIRTRIREAVILPQWIGVTFAIHNGKEYKQFTVALEMLGRRLGDFSHTTGRVLHSGPGVGATRGSKFMPLK
jgi:small subunit ribosomal protein S19